MKKGKIKIPKGPGRNPVKREQIVNFVKDNIINGTWPPGERIPPRTFFEKEFAASSVTVQQSLDQLNEDGFVRVKGRQGTFVSKKLPHQNNYALIFPDFPSEHRNSYLAIVDSESKKLQKTIPGKIICYYGINAYRKDPYYKLVEDIQERRLAGLIFTVNPFEVANTPILDFPDIPRVGFLSKDLYGFPVITLDSSNFIPQSIDYLLSKNCNRIAFMDTPGFSGHCQRFQALIAEKKGYSLEEWHQTAPHSNPEVAGRIVRLLMSEFYTERPNGLIITDDNLTPVIQDVLIEMGIKVPEQLRLVSHCNFPTTIPKNAKAPVKLIGYPIIKGLECCLNAINDLQEGKDVPSQTIISTQFE